jgi:hypothetical protein
MELVGAQLNSAQSFARRDSFFQKRVYQCCNFGC